MRETQKKNVNWNGILEQNTGMREIHKDNKLELKSMDVPVDVRV